MLVGGTRFEISEQNCLYTPISKSQCVLCSAFIAELDKTKSELNCKFSFSQVIEISQKQTTILASDVPVHVLISKCYHDLAI